ncbi:unnamed protein product [Caenorhabditis auriculariae]|uniref:Uncharacterized protein n=1 Tax=Caenorhabditis auriculariae TaxID=2777116 RepID=A0A8S1GTA5_9PELO|nr:unnamed protein product [Caenorhabditis auriculariae]
MHVKNKLVHINHRLSHLLLQTTRGTMAEVKANERNELDINTARQLGAQATLQGSDSTTPRSSLISSLSSRTATYTDTYERAAQRRKKATAARGRLTSKQATDALKAAEFVAASFLFTAQLGKAAVYFLIFSSEALINVFVNIYHIASFTYHKPAVAKDLAMTTYHLLKVSYDNNLLTMAEIYTVLRSNILAPMTKANATRNVERADHLAIEQSRPGSTSTTSRNRTSTTR